jgi:hypothetical protein
MATKKESQGNGVKTSLAVVAGIGALAGAYFLYGTDAGKKKRKEVKGWMLKAKGEVLEKIENIKDLSEDKYQGAVASVMKKYEGLREKYGEDVSVLYKELMSYWNHIKKHSAPTKKASKTGTKKTKSTS